MHEPLSQKLTRILETTTLSGQLTLNDLLEQTEGRGLFLVIIVLCLPFILPISVPGMSPPFGMAIALIAFRSILGKPPRLPRGIGGRALPPKVKARLARGGVKFLRFLERAVRPRESKWMAWPLARKANGLLMVFMALLLAVPMPPIPPFTNAFPSYSIILLSASMMEDDGVLIWAGYGACLLTVIYFGVCAELLARHFAPWLHGLAQFLHGLGL